jgi:cellobiose phosphorylase
MLILASLPRRYSSIRHTHITEEIKRTISAKQVDIKAAIGAADEQLVALGSRVEELQLTSDDQQADESTKSRAEALRQLEEERKAIAETRKLLDELLSKVQEEAVARVAGENQSRSTSVIFGDQNSGFHAGTISGGVSGLSFGGK